MTDLFYGLAGEPENFDKDPFLLGLLEYTFGSLDLRLDALEAGL